MVYNAHTPQIHAIHRHLGVCPQFDIQNADLTAEEHLLFYARLKGVKLSAEKAVVKRALRQVRKLFVSTLHEYWLHITCIFLVYCMNIGCTLHVYSLCIPYACR